MAKGDYVGKNINHSAAGERAARMSARAGDFFSDYTSGKTLEEIGSKHGITRERVRQIITKHYGSVAAHGGGAARYRMRGNKELAIMAKDEKYLKLRGCTFAQYKLLRDHPDKPTVRYTQQRRNSIERSIEWKLTLWEWWTAWQESGKWNRRGRKRGNYVMARQLDYGPYSLENIIFITASNNVRSIRTNIVMRGIDPTTVWPNNGRGERKQREPRPPRTHCNRGHELNDENVYLYKTGQRICKICQRDNKKKLYHEKKSRILFIEATQ